MATSTTSATDADASRENQNSRAIGPPEYAGAVRGRVDQRQPGVSLEQLHSAVTTASTVATAKPPTSVPNSSRAWVRASAPGPRRTRRGSHDQPDGRHQESEEQHAAGGVRQQRRAQPDEEERDDPGAEEPAADGPAPGQPVP